MANRKSGKIFVGDVGGWNFAPWRGSFYPEGLAHARELHYARSGLLGLGAKLGAINWQLAPNKRFDAQELADFLALLPLLATLER
jgi:uncharacterized protein YecE (DUF72 family)